MHSALRSAIAFNMKGIVAQKLLPVDQAGRRPRADRRDHDLQRQRAES